MNQETKTRFTPRQNETGERAEMMISESDYEVMRANGRKWVGVHDFISERNILVRVASCGTPGCMCDAVYKEIGE